METLIALILTCSQPALDQSFSAFADCGQELQESVIHYKQLQEEEKMYELIQRRPNSPLPSSELHGSNHRGVWFKVAETEFDSPSVLTLPRF